jgi:hypothetical protein
MCSFCNTLCTYATQGSRYNDLPMLYTVWNLFNQYKRMRTVSVNSHYLVLYKNPCGVTRTRRLAQQMRPKQAWFLLDAFNGATWKPFSYILLDLRSDTPDAIRVRARMVDTDTTMYVPV